MGNRAPQDRNWVVDGNPFFVNDDESLSQALMEAVTILTRIGGNLIISAHREEVAPDMWQTTGFGFRWVSYAPGKRKPDPEPELETSELEPDMVPVEA